MSRLSLIGITDCGQQNGLHAYHISCDIYVSVAAFAVPGVPVIFPYLANRPFASDILDGLDGTPITVTPFNIEPIHNNSGASIALGTACDSARPAFAAWCNKNTIAFRTPEFQRGADASNIARLLQESGNSKPRGIYE